MSNHTLSDSFWQQGALYRISEEEVFVVDGPLELIATDNPVTEAHVFIQEFFSGRPQHYRGSWAGKMSLSLFLGQVQRRIELFSPDSSDKPLQENARTLRAADFKPLAEESFVKDFQVIQRLIQREEIVKAVPITFREAPKVWNERQFLTSLGHCLRQSSKDLHVYGFWNSGEGLLGATPEILFHQKGTTLRTMALAGTTPNTGRDAGLALAKDPKQLREHRYVIDDLQSQLGQWGVLRIFPTQMLFLPRLIHLCTPMTLEGKFVPPEEWIQRLHPTPALGVSPRAYGRSWMRDLQAQSQRKWFGGPLGFNLEPQNTMCLVAIRNLQWSKSGSRIFAGAGLVADSQLEMEWQELQAKIESVFSALALNQG